MMAPARQMAPPKVGIHQVARQRLHKDAPASPDEVEVDPLAHEDLAAEQQLVVQGTWGYWSAGEPQETHSPVQPLRFQLLLEQVQRRSAVRRVQVIVDAVGGWELVPEQLLGLRVVFYLAAFVRLEQGAACEGYGLKHGERRPSWMDALASNSQCRGSRPC
jgi:hypothetical protein